MERIAKSVIEQMITSKLIENKDKELYIYSFQIVVEKVAGFLAILILAGMFHAVIQTFLFLLFFSKIRKHTGGFHLSSFYSCFFSTIGLYMFFVMGIYPLLIKNIEVNYILLLLAFIALMCIGAVNSEKINWSSKEHKENRKIARCIGAIEVFTIIIFSFLGMDISYLLFMSYGVILSTSLLLIEKIREEVWKT